MLFEHPIEGLLRAVFAQGKTMQADQAKGVKVDGRLGPCTGLARRPRLRIRIELIKEFEHDRIGGGDMQLIKASQQGQQSQRPLPPSPRPLNPS